MKRDIVWTTKFKKDYKLAIRRCLNIELLDDVIRALSRGETLPEKNRDHELTGDWRDIGNAIFSRTGCLFTASRMMCWC